MAKDTKEIRNALASGFHKLVIANYITVARGTYPYFEPFPSVDQILNAPVLTTVSKSKVGSKKKRKGDSKVNPKDEVSTLSSPSTISLGDEKNMNVMWEVNYNKFLSEWRNEVHQFTFLASFCHSYLLPVVFQICQKSNGERCSLCF